MLLLHLSSFLASDMILLSAYSMADNETKTLTMTVYTTVRFDLFDLQS